jgi:hypothetical protein
MQVLDTGIRFRAKVGEYYIDDGYIKHTGETDTTNVKSGVYQEFLNINAFNENEILSFCCKCGRLGVANRNETYDSSNPLGFYDEFEEMASYIHEINKFRALVALIEATAKHNIRNIVKQLLFLKFEADTAIMLPLYKQLFGKAANVPTENPFLKNETPIMSIEYKTREIEKTVAASDIDKVCLRISQANMHILLEAAREVAADNINHELQYVAPIVDITRGKVSTGWRFPNLLSVIYFDYLLRIDKVRVRQCVCGCGNFFEIEGNRENKIYYNSTCANRAAKRDERRRKRNSN